MLIKKPFKKGNGRIVAPYYKAAGGGGLGLQTSCTGFWEFETTSWLDSTGNGTTLTGTGAPTTTTGIVGNAASLVASTSYLQAANNANINSGGGSFSIQLWLNTASIAVGDDFFFSKSLATFGNIEWGLGTHFTTTNVFSFRCSDTSTTFFMANDTVVGTTGSFVHLIGTFDSSTGAMILYKNGSQVGTTTLTGTLNSSASAPLNFGNNGSTISSQNSKVDQAGFWKGRVLSAGDVTALYNSGSGLSYAAML